MKVIIGCECSGIIRDEFRKLGHEAWSCDLKPSETPGPHLQGNIFEYLGECQANNYKYWDLLIAHPPCTFNSLSSARWRWHPDDKNLPKLLRRPHPNYIDRKDKQQAAIDFFKALWNANIDRICLENPRPLKSLVYQVGNYTQVIQPYDFGEDASKETCLWLKNLPRLKHTSYFPPRIVDGKKRWGNQTDSGQNKLPPSEKRAEDRSRTYIGVAAAMASQWSVDLIK